jgi:hypothetical protein
MDINKRVARGLRRLARGQKRLVVVRGVNGRLQVIVKNTAADAADLVARINASHIGRVTGVI